MKHEPNSETNNPLVLLLFGGESSEHDVSIMSAKNVYNGIDKAKYEAKLCYITRSGNWILIESFDNLHGPEISPLLGKGCFKVGENELKVDVVFPVLHGENGSEDGTVQGLLNLMHIPYVGCGIGASVVCWDKIYTKQILEASQIKTTPYTYFSGIRVPDYDEVASGGEDLFVKPATSGSSVGVSKIRSKGEFELGFKLALENSSRVLIEKAVKGREFEVAVLTTGQGLCKVSGVGEIIPGEEFYNYDDKYLKDSKAQVIIKADISDDLRNEIRDIARRAFYVLGCKGLARVDFLVSDAGEIYVNEVNTMPGFTNISMYPKLWQQEGITQTDLITQLIDGALNDTI